MLNKLYNFHLYYLVIIFFIPVHLSAETIPSPEAEENQQPPIETVEPTPEQEMELSREREIKSEEDPVMQRQNERLEKPVSWFFRPDEFKIYGSARIRYRYTDTDSFLGDGGSRVGMSGHKRFNSDIRLFARAELGVNLLDELDLLFSRGDSAQGNNFGDTVFIRLLNAGFETPDSIVTLGKSWSTYYQVTSFTDRFQGAGASASGTFNSGTDGGYTGTGRADRVLQGRFLVNTAERLGRLKPFKLNMQLQHGEPIPTIDGFNYQTTFGLSAIMENRDDFSFGIAYNHAIIDSDDLNALRNYGIDGDATALALGLRWFGSNWYLGTVVSRLENHETTDEDIYFDGIGWEVYGQYNFYKKWWAVAGWNYLEPDRDEVQAGEFEIDYSILGLRYAFRDFQQMIFANARFESSNIQDGTALGNVYTIGFRWDLP